MLSHNQNKVVMGDVCTSYSKVLCQHPTSWPQSENRQGKKDHDGYDYAANEETTRMYFTW